MSGLVNMWRLGEGGKPGEGVRDPWSFPHLALGISSLALPELCSSVINLFSSKFNVSWSSVSPSSSLMESKKGVFRTSDLNSR